MVRKVEAGELSREEFCKRTGLKECSFHYWKKKYREQSLPERKFIPISADDTASGQRHMVELELGNGVKVRFSSLVPVDYIGRLIEQG